MTMRKLLISTSLAGALLLDSVIVLLIYICIFALVVYLVLWVLQQLGIALPPMVIKIFWIIVALVVLLMLVRMVLPSLRSGRLGLGMAPSECAAPCMPFRL